MSLFRIKSLLDGMAAAMMLVFVVVFPVIKLSGVEDMPCWSSMALVALIVCLVVGTAVTIINNMGAAVGLAKDGTPEVTCGTKPHTGCASCPHLRAQREQWEAELKARQTDMSFREWQQDRLGEENRRKTWIHNERPTKTHE